MKKAMFLLVFLQITVCFAQRPNGGRRGGAGAGQTAQRPEMPKFEAAKAAGLIAYEAKKVSKKLKLKKKDSVSIEVTKHIDSYNLEIQKLKTSNKDLFEGLDIVVNQNMETAVKTKNRELMQTTRLMIEEKLEPVRAEVKIQEERLNTALEATLTEAQNKKWLDYQKSEKDKLKPKRKSRNDARNRPDNSNGGNRRRG